MFQTEQEKFWAGEFGNDYIDRNKSSQLLAGNISFFSKIFERVGNISSIVEFGANIGMNLKALHMLNQNCELTGVEINEEACRQLTDLGYVKAEHQSILDLNLTDTYDLAFIKGVMIHINPEHLNTVYENLYKASKKYILVAEYYNPTPVAIPYRGHDDRLFKRDFAGEMLDKYQDLKLIDYGFLYRNDPMFPQDDITWFLMEKN